jgi:hypothetical protein
MAITVSGGVRPKLTTTTSLSTNLTALTPTEAGSDIQIRVVDNTFAATTFNVVADITTGSDTLVGATNAFANIRVGDVLNSTSLDTDSVVTAKTNNQTIVVDQVATGTATGESVAVTTGTLNATYYIVKLAHSLSGNKLTVVPTIYTMDGTKVSEGAVEDNDDNATTTDGTPTTLAGVTIDIDTFLTNARVPRVNA